MENEIPVVFRGITKEDILAACEVVIVGITGDAIPVVPFNGNPIHEGKPGPIAKRLRQMLIADLQENGTALA